MPLASPHVPSRFDRIVRDDRIVVTMGLAAIVLLAWTSLFRIGADMNAMAGDARMHEAMGMADMRVWGLSDFMALFTMWAVMMVAMMLPSAAPIILLVLAVFRRRGDPHARVAAVAFIAGYVLAWTMFSGLAAGAQLALHRAALLSTSMASRSTWLAGTVLIVAGAYQWLPAKQACLSHCQSPIGFLTAHWREGAVGGLSMGMRHGLFCIGCCWALMTLLFVVGVMNLLWVAGIAAFVLVEKLAAQGRLLGRVAGLLLIAWGIVELAV